MQWVEPRRAVLARPKHLSHALHIVLTVLTCGWWGLVYIILAVTRGTVTQTLVVDDAGRVSAPGWSAAGAQPSST